jgi:hypothetical protein
VSDQQEETGGQQLEAPNKQAVGLDPPWVEGTGGSGGTASPRRAKQARPADEAGTAAPRST